jgi:hypothetical protein
LIEKRQTSLFSGVWREIREKIIKISQKNAKFDEEIEKKSEIQSRSFRSASSTACARKKRKKKFNYSIAKCFWRFLTKKLRLENGAKECIV